VTAGPHTHHTYAPSGTGTVWRDPAIPPAEVDVAGGAVAGYTWPAAIV
jgi:hypothetical protein